MKKIFSLFAAVLFAGSMMAGVVTINATDYTDGESGATGVFSFAKDGISLDWEGAFYNNENNQDFRVYANKTLKVSASVDISKVEIVGYAKKDLAVTIDNGEITAGANYSSETTKKDWDDPLIVVEGINAKSVTFTCNKQMRAFSIRVTTAGDAPTAVDNATVGVKAQKVVRDGQLYIIRDGVMFNANGAAVK